MGDRAGGAQRRIGTRTDLRGEQQELAPVTGASSCPKGLLLCGLLATLGRAGSSTRRLRLRLLLRDVTLGLRKGSAPGHVVLTVTVVERGTIVLDRLWFGTSVTSLWWAGAHVSERNFQTERLGQWTKGKSHDTFGPVGPWLATKDEIKDVQNLSMWLDVNGQRRQTGSTQTMIFSMAKCISYVSQFMTLLPGDIVTTGTPPGVGLGMKPPTFLNVGDVVTLGIEGLGEQRQEIVAA